MNTPTPETDAEIRHFDHTSATGYTEQVEYVESDVARKLERERDEAREKSNSYQMALEEEQECHTDEKIERDQLRKVCDELARDVACIIAEIKGSLTGLATHPTQEFNGFCISKLSQEKLQSLRSLSTRYEKQQAYNSLPHVKEINTK